MQRCDSVPVKPGPRSAAGPARRDVFTRNVQYMVSQVAGEHAARTFQMLQATFPGLRNFDQLRTFARLYVSTGLKPLQFRPLPSEVDPQRLKGELALRFHNGMIVLTPDERIVCRGADAYGPFDPVRAARFSRQLSAESPTNDDKGHTLDPEACAPSVVGMFPLDLS